MADSLKFEISELEILETFDHEEEVQRPEELRFYTLDEQLTDFFEKNMPQQKLSRSEEKKLKQLRDRIKTLYEKTIIVTDTDYSIAFVNRNVNLPWIHPVYTEFQYNKYSFKKEWEPIFSKEQRRTQNFYQRLINALPKPFKNIGVGRPSRGSLVNNEGKESINLLNSFESSSGIIADDGSFKVVTKIMENTEDTLNVSGFFLDERPFEIPRPIDNPFLKSNKSVFFESVVPLIDVYPGIEAIMEHAIPTSRDPYDEGMKYLNFYGLSLNSIPWISWKERFLPAEYRDVPIPIQTIPFKQIDNEKPSESILKVYSDWNPGYNPRFWLTKQIDGGTLVAKILLSEANNIGSLTAFPYLGKVDYDFPETDPEVCQNLTKTFDSFLEGGIYRNKKCIPVSTILQEKIVYAYKDRIPWKETTKNEIIMSYKKILDSFIPQEKETEIKYTKVETKNNSERRRDILAILNDERDDGDKAEALERITRDLEFTDNIYYDLAQNFVLCEHTIELLKGVLKFANDKLNFYGNWTVQIEGYRMCKFCGELINSDTLVAVKEYDSQGHLVMEYEQLDSTAITLHSLTSLKPIFDLENSGEYLIFLSLSFLQIVPNEQQLIPILQLIRSFTKGLKGRSQQTGKISKEDIDFTEGLFGIAGIITLLQTHNPFLIPKRKLGSKQFETHGYPRDSTDPETCHTLKSTLQLLELVLKTFPALYKGGISQLLRKILKKGDDLKVNALRWIKVFYDKFKTLFDNAKERYKTPELKLNTNFFSIPSEKININKEIVFGLCKTFRTIYSWKTKRTLTYSKDEKMPILTPHSFELLDKKYIQPISQDFTQKEILKRLSIGLSGFPFVDFIKNADYVAYISISSRILSILKNSSFSLKEQIRFRSMLQNIDEDSSLARDISKGIFMELLSVIKPSQPLVRVVLDSLKKDITLKLLLTEKIDAEKQDLALRAQERNTLKAALRRMNDAEREISQKTLALGISEFIITNKQREKFFKEYEEMNEDSERDYIENGNLPVADDGTELQVDYGDYGDRAVTDYNDYTEQHVIDED